MMMMARVCICLMMKLKNKFKLIIQNGWISNDLIMMMMKLLRFASKSSIEICIF